MSLILLCSCHFISLCLYMHGSLFLSLHVFLFLYIYIYRERERKRDRERNVLTLSIIFILILKVNRFSLAISSKSSRKSPPHPIFQSRLSHIVFLHLFGTAKGGLCNRLNKISQRAICLLIFFFLHNSYFVSIILQFFLPPPPFSGSSFSCLFFFFPLSFSSSILCFLFLLHSFRLHILYSSSYNSNSISSPPPPPLSFSFAFQKRCLHLTPPPFSHFLLLASHPPQSLEECCLSENRYLRFRSSYQSRPSARPAAH